VRKLGHRSEGAKVPNGVLGRVSAQIPPASLETANLQARREYLHSTGRGAVGAGGATLACKEALVSTGVDYLWVPETP
jgi:hypothetical protein